jgi:pimeloyl-ACP methyl ester carboxylesterase
MRGLAIVAAALFGVALLAYALGLGIYAVASTQPTVSTQPRSQPEAALVLERYGLDDLYPFEHRFLLTPHGRMHFADEGRGGEGRVMLCLHSSGGWSLECAGMIQNRPDGARVIAPDLIGFGLSEKPSTLPADPIQAHAEDLAVLVEILDLRDVEVTAASSSEPIAVALVRLEPQRVRSSIVHGGARADDHLVESLARAPVLGEVLVQGLGALSPGFARSPLGRLQASWDERASALALARANVTRD